jgi:hypothetical protein
MDTAKAGFLFLALATLPAFAQAPRIEITRLDGSIRVDGQLDDSGWSHAAVVTTFYEYWTADNQPPAVATTARLAYDDQALYVAFDALDPRPREIRAPYLDRDAVGTDQDYVEVLIDSRGDRQAATRFRVNARGIQTDSVLNDATGAEDLSPDFFFTAAARVTDRGWTAELRIPLTSLHYGTADPQEWRVILSRNYPRAFRYVMASAPIPKSSPCFVCHAGILAGLRGLPRAAHLDVAPYTSAAVTERTSRRDTEKNAGGDVKWSPQPELTLDATLRPDFSQIESDAPQITTNRRFALDVPEKRPFFLESVDLLATPTRVAYTRSITQPRWGARMTAQRGPLAYTLLAADDEGGGLLILPGPLSSVVVPQDFASHVFIARVRRTIGASFLGAIASVREVDGGGHNRVAGPDLYWHPDDKNQLTAQFLVSDTRDPRRPDLSPLLAGGTRRGSVAAVSYTHATTDWTLYSGARQLSSGFRADNGFVPQVGYRTAYGELDRNYYPKGRFPFVQWWVGAQAFQSSDDGRLLRYLTYPGVSVRGPWNSDIWMTIHPLAGEEVNGRLLRYSYFEYALHTNPSRSLPLLSIEGAQGGKLDYDTGRRGRGGSLSLGASVRAGDHLAAELSARREWLDVDQARRFTADIGRLKLTYTLSARAFVRAIAQSSEVSPQAAVRNGNSALSLLLAYRLDWQTSFYLGYGDAGALDDHEHHVRQARSLFVKATYAIHR